MDKIKLSELVKNGATLYFKPIEEEEEKDRIYPLNVILPGKIHYVNIEMKFTDE